MEIQFYKTIVKMKKPKYNMDKGFFGVVEETPKYYIICPKNYGTWTGGWGSGSDRRKVLKSTFEEKFEQSDYWYCHRCTTNSLKWRCTGCWPETVK